MNRGVELPGYEIWHQSGSRNVSGPQFSDL